MQAGNVFETIVLRATSEDFPVLEIPVSAWLEDDVVCEPRFSYKLVKSNGGDRRATVRIVDKKARPITILPDKSTFSVDRPFAVEINNADKANEKNILVTLAEGYPEGNLIKAEFLVNVSAENKNYLVPINIIFLKVEDI